ncbi:uncharacterized protein LOC112567432 isoform X2 [Pomacea canaliculata]|uniref:uncharacterized protein LOC112567432 isoform X2 n=1 Tax=Pomacea canaliculata TaxID=400727 RepID=UPI000D734BCB|nr:uncharacterized protein LOC112567432 isoform X2 [Pomacea canaliculata]
MACILQYGKQYKLRFPEGEYKKNFKLNWCPAQGTQKTIIRCKWSDSYKCDTEDGFEIEFPSDNEALITLPENLRDTPASLNCQLSGQTVTRLEECSLPVRGNPMGGNTVEPQGVTDLLQSAPEPLLPMSEDSGKGDTNLGIVIGCIIGAGIIFTILLIIFLFRRYKHKQSLYCSEKPNMNESPVVGHVNKIMVENEQNTTRKETYVSDIDEMKPFLWNEQESNEKNACNKGSEKKSSDGESDKTKNDEGIDEKGSDEKKSSDKESDKTKNDEGFEEKGSDEEKSSDCDTDENNSDEGFEEKSGSSKLGGEKHG